MQQYLIDYIMKITDKEINKKKENLWAINFYTRDNRIDANKQKKIGLQSEAKHKIALRLHERFIDFPIHSHNYIEMMYVCSGNITHIIDGREIKLENGDFIILNKNTKHALKKTTADDIGINIIVSPILFQSIIDEWGVDTDYFFQSFLYDNSMKYLYFKAGEILPIENLMENLVYSLYMSESVNDEILTKTLFLMILYLSKHPKALQINSDIKINDEFYKAVQKYINDNYKTATLEELSKRVALSPAYLSRKITNVFGMNFKDLHKRTRLMTAAKLLRTTDCSVGEIILDIGYENTSYFHREFKKIFDATPKKYRTLK